MSRLQVIDRIALAAIFSTIAAIPLLSHASSDSYPRADRPAATLALSGGVERRFYTTGPMGTTTRRVDVSQAGAVLSDVQVLNDDTFRDIQSGMPATEVFARLGPPYAKMRFEATRTTAWDYHYRDTWGYDADFSVIVGDDGVTVGKVSIRNGN